MRWTAYLLHLLRLPTSRRPMSRAMKSCTFSVVRCMPEAIYLQGCVASLLSQWSKPQQKAPSRSSHNRHDRTTERTKKMPKSSF